MTRLGRAGTRTVRVGTSDDTENKIVLESVQDIA
jgi:hypothetical protein